MFYTRPHAFCRCVCVPQWCIWAFYPHWPNWLPISLTQNGDRGASYCTNVWQNVVWGCHPKCERPRVFGLPCNRSRVWYRDPTPPYHAILQVRANRCLPIPVLHVVQTVCGPGVCFVVLNPCT